MGFFQGWKAWEETKNILRQAIFLPRCRICSARLAGTGERILCRGCRSRIRISGRGQCRLCGKYLSEKSGICGACAVIRPPFLLHASYAAYDEPLKTLIRLYKYAGFEPLKKLFAALYLELHARRVDLGIDLVVPVPADRSRRREFQPVAAAAVILAAKLRLPFADGILLKVRSTPPQAGLSQAERMKNLRGAFSVRAGAGIAGKTVLLLDDVYTTGTTVRTCARALRKAGCRIVALTLAQSSIGDFGDF